MPDVVTNKNAVIRLSKYKNVLRRMHSRGVVRVYSSNLGNAVGVKASQVRKDFSFFKITGNKKGGYIVDDLLSMIHSILGKNSLQKAIIIGCGNIGSALMNYREFQRERITIVAGFDTDEGKIDPARDIPILPMSELKPFVREHRVKVGILAVPESAAQDVLDTMLAAGVEGILNFAPLRLVPSSPCVINNVNLAVEIENLFYFVNHREYDPLPTASDEDYG